MSIHRHEPDGAFSRAVAVYAAIVLFAVGGFVAGWAMRGEQEAPYLQQCRASMSAIQVEHRTCMTTLEQSWKQSREIGASLIKCKDTLARVYSKDLYGR